MIKRFEDLSYQEQFEVFKHNDTWHEDAWRIAEDVANSYVEDDMAQTPYIRGYVGDRGEYIEVTDINAFAGWVATGDGGVIPVKTMRYLLLECSKILRLNGAVSSLAELGIYVEDECYEKVDEIKQGIEDALLSWLKSDIDNVYDEQFRFDVLIDAIDSGYYDIGEVWVDTESWKAVRVDCQEYCA